MHTVCGTSVHPFRSIPPARRLLSALQLFPTAWGIPLLVLVTAIGLWLDLVVVIIPVARVAISGVPNVGVGALEPPCVSAWCRTASAASSRSDHIGGIRGTSEGSL
jgi:hypothetical protein